jgi:hypothetical protein
MAAGECGTYRITTTPATIKPKKRGTGIGGTSHPCKPDFWMLDTFTALRCGGSPKLSVTDSSQRRR